MSSIAATPKPGGASAAPVAANIEDDPRFQKLQKTPRDGLLLILSLQQRLKKFAVDSKGLHREFQKLQDTLQLREEELVDKGRQLNELQLTSKTRDDRFKKKLHDTEEEANKQILRAEMAEARLQEKQSIIDELMTKAAVKKRKQRQKKADDLAAKREKATLKKRKQRQKKINL